MDDKIAVWVTEEQRAELYALVAARIDDLSQIHKEGYYLREIAMLIDIRKELNQAGT